MCICSASATQIWRRKPWSAVSKSISRSSDAATRPSPASRNGSPTPSPFTTLSSGLRAQLSYTFSRSVDDSSGINSQDYSNGSVYVLDYYDRKADRGVSTFWAQHVFTGNWSYELPFAKSMTGVGGLLLKGWQLNSITTVQTGHPFEVRMGFNRSGNLNTVNYAMHERPDLKPGFSNNPILGGPDRYWDINAFALPPATFDSTGKQLTGQRGNLGRNTLIGPSLFNFDLAVAKAFPIDEKRRFEFRGEMFNLLNHPNFGLPSGLTTFTNATTLSPTAGVISTTVTTSRQIQFGLKFIF